MGIGKGEAGPVRRHQAAVVRQGEAAVNEQHNALVPRGADDPPGRLQHLVHAGVAVGIVKAAAAGLFKVIAQLLLPGDAHGIGCAPGCEFVRIFNCNVLREEFQKEFLHFAAELEIAPDDLLARGMIPPGARRKLIFEDCEALLARRGKFGRFRNALLRTLLSQLLWVLLRQSGVEENGAPKWLLDACAAMHREENFRAGLKRLVELSGRTQEHLNRTMRKHFGMTPRGYLTNLRLEAVFQELIQGRCDITSAAFRAGFVNLAGFRRAFRKKYLVSPRQIKELGHHSGSGGA